MEIEFDPAKDAANVELRGISLARALDMDWATVIIAEDRRFDYGEVRFVALGFIDDRLHVLVYTIRPAALRVISLRWASSRERRRYERQRPPA